MQHRSGHKWSPIEDLPPSWPDLALSELRSLGDVWSEQRHELAGSDGLRRFNERLHREWAIETGIIERVYSLDRGITVLLIEHGIDAALIPSNATDKDPQLVARIIQDQHEAIDFLFDVVRGRRDFSLSFIKELHAPMTRHQATTLGWDQFGSEVEIPLLHGDWKRWPNNPTRSDGSIHEYCPPEQVQAEMERLGQMHTEHVEQGVPPEVEAAWLHHRFTQIHPFQDGNGRVARALASLVLIQAGWFPLVVRNDDRDDYIDALEQADDGELDALVAEFAAIERRAFVQAVGVAREVLADTRRLDQVLDMITLRFVRRDRQLQQHWEQAKATATEVLMASGRTLSHVRDRLTAAGIRAFVDAADDESQQRDWYRYQAMAAARELDFFANWRSFSAWSRLRLVNESEARVLVLFTAIGREFRGLIGVTVTYDRLERVSDQQREAVDFTCVSEELFQINYKESAEATLDRFGPWLDRALAVALATWGQSDLGP